MHAIQIAATGGPDVLTYVEVPTPTPGPRQVLMRTEAIGVNFIDTYFRTGMYPHSVPFILGCEVSPLSRDEAATSGLMPSGTWAVRSTLATQYSA